MRVRAIKTTVISILAVSLLAGSAVGVAAQSAIVTGSIETAENCVVTPEASESCTGGRFEFDDPRLTGDYETTITIVSGFESGIEGDIATEELRVTNYEGAWSGQSVMGVFIQDGEPVSGGTNWVLTGEDAYEGLTAWVYMPFDDFMGTQGLIIDAEPVSAE